MPTHSAYISNMPSPRAKIRRPAVPFLAILAVNRPLPVPHQSQNATRLSRTFPKLLAFPADRQATFNLNQRNSNRAATVVVGNRFVERAGH